MNKFLIAGVAIFSSIVISETKAACNNDDYVCGANCCATLDDAGVLTISGTGEMYDYTYKEVNGEWYMYDINNNKDPFFNNANIKEVKFAPDSNITKIGDYAFMRSSNISSVEMPNSVTSVGNGSFDSVSSLTSVNMPNVTSVGNDAFVYTSISDLSMPNVETIGDNAFEGYSGESLYMPNVTSIGKEVFRGSWQLRDLYMPNVETIGKSAFYMCYNLTTIEIPDSLLNVGTDAFSTILYDNGDVEYIISDSVDTSGWSSFAIAPFLLEHSLTFKCKGDQAICEQQMQKFASNLDVEPIYKSVNNQADCNGGMYEWDSATSTCKRMGENSCNETDNYYYNGNTCTRRPKNGQVACSSSYKVNDGYCDRIRYTPAEAAKVLHDDNTNSVTITFKK